MVETCLGLCPFWFSRQVTGKVAVLLLALHALLLPHVVW